MINALNAKKKEIESLIDNRNESIGKLEAEVKSYEAKLAIVDEMIADELKKTETVEAVPVVDIAKDETVVIRCTGNPDNFKDI